MTFSGGLGKIFGSLQVNGSMKRAKGNIKDLTRFNKICHPNQRPTWQVDKEAIGLSRVHQFIYV